MQANCSTQNTGVEDILRKLKQHSTECFVKDVPLYLILSYRFHIMYSYYDCDELGGFINDCIDKLESIDPKAVASAIIGILERYVGCFCQCIRLHNTNHNILLQAGELALLAPCCTRLVFSIV